MNTAERYQRAKTIFLEACEMASAEVDPYLQRACDGDSGLRREIESMLEQDRRGDDGIGAQKNESVLDAGTLIGRYRIVGLIGEGGMGIVYEAEQENPRRTVALKVIRPGLATPAMLRRFEHEAQALARLQHPGIAQIFEAGRADGPRGRVAFFAMERVCGTPLLEFAGQRDLGLIERIELGARVADAVQHAHQRGVVHRDLKPANILVDQTGQPKVLDFGVARMVDEKHGATVLTSAGQIIGTVAYMSPEQAAGDPAAIDTRSDIYSLGVVLYELLTGRLPYPVAGVALHEALRVIGEADPVRMSSIDRRLRGDVATITQRALEKDRSRRYQACGELAEDLRRHLRDEPILARPPTAVYQLRKFARRHKAIVGGAAIAAAAMLIGTAVSLRQAAVAVAARKIADEKTVAAERQAARATIEAATVASEQGDAVTARRLLESVSGERRAWEWRYLSAHLDTCAALLTADDAIGAARLSPDGLEAMTVTRQGRVQWWRLSDSQGLRGCRIDGELTGAMELSADGSRLAGVLGTKKDRLGLWDTSTGGLVAEVSSPVGSVEAIAVSPTGDRVAAGGKKSFLWTPGAPGDQAVVAVHAPDVHAFSFSEDGTRLGATYMAHIVDYDGRTGAFSHKAWALPDGPPTAIGLSEDGGEILAAAARRIWLYRAQTGERLREFTGHATRVQAVELDLKNGRAASGDSAGTVRLWDTTSGQQLAVLSGATAAIRQVGFGSSGRVWAVSGAELRVWDVPEPTDTETLRGHERYVYAAAPIGGTDRAVSGAWDRTLRVWNWRTGEELAKASCPAGIVLAAVVVPAPDGQPGAVGGAHSPVIVAAHDPAAKALTSRVSLWNADTLTLMRELAIEGSGRVSALALSGDGKRLAARNSNRLVVLDTALWTPVASIALRESRVFAGVALSPDGSLTAASGPGKGVTVWRVSDGVIAATLGESHDVVQCLAFSPDGRLLAGGSTDTTVRVWDGTDWREVRCLRGHTDRVYAIAFSPDGSRLASGANDMTARVWNVAGGESVSVLRGHTDYVYAVAFTPDGSALLSGSGDSTVRVWGTDPANVRLRARALASRLRDETRPLVDGLWTRLGDWGAVADALHADPGLGPERREAALQVVVGRAAGSGATQP